MVPTGLYFAAKYLLLNFLSRLIFGIPPSIQVLAPTFTHETHAKNVTTEENVDFPFFILFVIFESFSPIFLSNDQLMFDLVAYFYKGRLYSVCNKSII